MKQEISLTDVELTGKTRKGLLERIKLKRSYGVYIEDDKLYFADVIRTPKGAILQKSVCGDLSTGKFQDYIEKLFPASTSSNSKKKIESFKKNIDLSKLQDYIKKLLPENLQRFFSFLQKSKKQTIQDTPKKLKKKKRLPLTLSLAIPGKELFYIGSPISEEGSRKLSLESLISENPRFAFITSSDIVCDWFSSKLNKQNFVFVGAAKYGKVKNILQDFYKIDIHPTRIEPEPWAALRASLYFTRSKVSRGELEIRFLLGDTTIIAILTNGKIPLAWQYNKFDRDNINDIIYSLTNSLMVYANWQLKLGEIKGVVIHGEGDLSEQAQALEKEIGIPVMISSGPSYSGHLIAFGLALGALTSDTQGINLARTVQKPPGLMAIFPFFEAIVAGVMVILVLLNTFGKIEKYSRRLNSIKMENASAGWAIGKNLLMLNAEKSKILKQVEPLSNYVAKKINWSPYLESLGTLVPKNAYVVGVEAEDQIWTKTISTKGERYLMIRIVATFPPGGKAPEEIDESINAFRNYPLFQKELPEVQLAEIHWKKDESEEQAYFSVLATPKVAKAKKGKG